MCFWTVHCMSHLPQLFLSAAYECMDACSTCSSRHRQGSVAAFPFDLYVDNVTLVGRGGRQVCVEDLVTPGNYPGASHDARFAGRSRGAVG